MSPPICDAKQTVESFLAATAAKQPITDLAAINLVIGSWIVGAVVMPEYTRFAKSGWVAVAIPFIVLQRDLKRLLAYSSVEHVGLIAVGWGLGGPIGYYFGLLHLINHALTKALLFFAAGELVQRYGTRRIAAIRGAIQAVPFAGTLLLLGAFAITGLPPFGVFLSELGIVTAGVAQGRWPVAVAVVTMLAAVFAGFLAHAAGITFGRATHPAPEHAPPTPAARPGYRLTPLAALALVLPASGVVLLGLYLPPPLDQALQAAARLCLGGG